MNPKKRELTKKEIKDLKASDLGTICSSCGVKLTLYNVSNDGDICKSCYEKNALRK